MNVGLARIVLVVVGHRRAKDLGSRLLGSQSPLSEEPRPDIMEYLYSATTKLYLIFDTFLWIYQSRTKRDTGFYSSYSLRDCFFDQP